jgi:FMN hydrolase / 5-amino-6-(5-phospho-D-ribitylamino)uracil phosphatase
MRIKAVLFDLDDTLWPVAPVIQHAESTLQAWMLIHTPKVAQHYSIEQLRHHRNALVKTNPRFEYDLWTLRHTLLSNVFMEVGEDPQKADIAMAVFADARNQVALYDDVVPGLSALSERFALGTVSNGFADLHKIGISSHFKVSLAAHSFGCAKPDPRIFMAACAALQLLPDQVMYVGDDLALDVLGAQQVGMRGVWMNRHHVDLAVTRHSHVQPDVIVTNLHDVIQCL